jgi:hypothetical protein
MGRFGRRAESRGALRPDSGPDKQTACVLVGKEVPFLRVKFARVPVFSGGKRYIIRTNFRGIFFFKKNSRKFSITGTESTDLE